MKWIAAVLIALFVTVLLILGFTVVDSAISGAVDVWSKSDAALSVPQTLLISVWILVKKYSLFIAVLIFPISLAISLVIASRKKVKTHFNQANG